MALTDGLVRSRQFSGVCFPLNLGLIPSPCLFHEKDVTVRPMLEISTCLV